VEEFRVCPSCGDEREFHVFLRAGREGRAAIGLVCPGCGRSYDVGWTARDIPGGERRDGDRYGSDG
jgi:uncharacterized Zn finger protein